MVIVGICNVVWGCQIVQYEKFIKFNMCINWCVIRSQLNGSMMTVIMHLSLFFYWKVTKGAMVITRGNKFETLDITFNSKDMATVANPLLVLIYDIIGWETRRLQLLISHLVMICDIVSWDTWVRRKWKYFNLKGSYPGRNLEHSSSYEFCIFHTQKNVTFSKIEKNPKGTNLEFLLMLMYRDFQCYFT